MARRTHPDTATSQFYINLVAQLRAWTMKYDYQPGYTVFGRISKGMDVIDKISVVETTTVGHSNDVPKEDIVLISAKRKAPADPVEDDKKAAAPVKEAAVPKETADAAKQEQDAFVAGEHYVVLDRPVPTRDSSKVEVVELFSYGCSALLRV